MNNTLPSGQGFAKVEEIKKEKSILEVDGRAARGKRYDLAALLVLLVLAKLAGMQSLLRASEWIKDQQVRLRAHLHLSWTRVLISMTICDENDIGRRCTSPSNTPLRSLYKCCTANGEGAGTDSDPSTRPRLYSWGKNHLGEQASAKCESVKAKPINSLYRHKDAATADSADHSSPIGSTPGRKAQLDENGTQGCRSHRKCADSTPRRFRIFPVTSIA